MDAERLRSVTERIREEHRKYADKEGIDWAEIAAAKVISLINSATSNQSMNTRRPESRQRQTPSQKPEASTRSIPQRPEGFFDRFLFGDDRGL